MPVNSPCAPAAGCKRDGVHAGDFEQRVLEQLCITSQRALRERSPAVGMRVGEALEARDELR